MFGFGSSAPKGAVGGGMAGAKAGTPSKGIDPMMLMMAMQGMGGQQSNPATTINPLDQYTGQSNPMNAMPFQTPESEYAKKVKMALMGGGI